ncbi:PAS domain-containing protein [Hymenobacter humi]|uniref:histidine kinase n=1 Tax=Hymenobacter humi TaxID=1411620 RepID=A0ABW2UBV3_9BACT
MWRDVTAEREAATRLRESEARLSMALSASETGVVTWDLTTGLVQWDERSQAAFGRPYDLSPVHVESLFESIHAEDRPQIRAATDEALAKHTPLALEYRVVWPDGSVHNITSAGSTVANAQGETLTFVGVVRDVTALHLAQSELHYKTLVLERLLGNMPMMLARFAPDGTYLESTGQACRPLG